MTTDANRKLCFVVQGYRKKTDYATGRVLDLDASYDLIKEAVEAADMRCIRCDEVLHSGVIDAQMYRLLYEADLVIADLSTSNLNAAIELGVRHALRPRATLLIAEEKFNNPFDTGHTVMLRYVHQGDDIARLEGKRFSRELTAMIRAVLDNDQVDSPVYTYLPQLQPPRWASAATDPDGAAASTGSREAAFATTAADALDTSLRQLMDTAQLLMDQGNFSSATSALRGILAMRPGDSAVIQKLALATYKAALPTLVDALRSARDVLRPLAPQTTNDPETLGLWGAVHKRLWEEGRERADLDEAITAYERGFFLKQDHYNGINFAFLLDARAEQFRSAGDINDAITDATLANRVRRDVDRYAGHRLAEMSDDADEKRYWVVATLWESALGQGDQAGLARWEKELTSMKVPGWMDRSRREQGAKLQDLIGQRSPPAPR